MIRPIETTDVPMCVEFGLEAFRPVFASFCEHYGDELFGALRPDWENAQSAYIEGACTAEDKETWVSVLGGVVVGFVVITVDTDSGLGQIELLAVAPGHQNAGIGTELNDFAVELLRGLGMKFVVVGTGDDPGHAPARRSYEKAGFEPMKIQPHLLVRRL